MTLPNGIHTSRPWRIHEFTRDFRFEHALGGPVKGRSLGNSEPTAIGEQCYRLGRGLDDE